MSFSSGIVIGLPGMVQAASNALGGSKQKWRERRLALDWLHWQGPETWVMPATKQELKVALKRWRKWRVRLWRLEHGNEQLGRVIKAWRTNNHQRDELGELIADRLGKD